MIKDFSSLHNHSHFSLLDGISLPEEMVLAAKNKGLKSIAITDHGNCHGHADFFLFGKKHGVRTIFGVEAYVVDDLDDWFKTRERMALEKKTKKKKKAESDDDDIVDDDDTPSDARLLRRKGHLVILACNREGLSNIYEVVYRSFRDGFYGKPRCDKKMLRAHSAGLVATSACMGGVISNKCWELRRGECTWEDVLKEARQFDEIFGRGRFFLEMQFNELDDQRFINDCMVRIHDETGIPLTVAADSHYVEQNGWESQEILYMMRSKKSVATRGPDWNFGVKQLYIKSPTEMWEAFEKFGGKLDPKVAIEAFQNTLLIDSLVENFEPDTSQRLPTLPYDNPFKELGQRCIDGLKNLGLANDEKYKKQLLYELGVIRDKGFSNYFLITQRIVEEAKKVMWIGAGRGSAAGGLVCYALGITDLDPIQYDLMFERFMDPSRTDWPDIDIDFENVGETKALLRKMFGSDNVACLSVYGTFQIKGLLKDVGRVYDIDHNEINDANKKIDKELKALLGDGEDKSSLVIKLDDVIRVSPTFNKLMEKYPHVGKQLKALYNRNRHVGRHASGVIIGDNLPKETALWVSRKKDADDDDVADNIVQTSFTEGIVNKNLSSMGFVKFDILSIATLKIIHYALKLVSKKTGVPLEELRENMRPHKLDLNDEKVLKNVFWNGNACGVFQFTGNGIRKLAQQVKPDKFDDVSAITSLYRPGPLASGMCELFVKNKNNPESIVYEHPILEQLLKSTRGTMIFQEQLMKLCQLLGKMQLKDVQRIRKNLLKKIKGRSEEFLKAENEELSGKFIKGCMENGLTEERAKQWWSDIKGWGSYGFNKSHSHTYSVMTMQCAHLATYHPLEFYTAVLARGQSAELQDYVSDIRRQGIKILEVDVNKSNVEHSIEDGSIRLCLSSIKGVGRSAAEKIVASRPYTSFLDFLERSKVSKTAIDPLIKVGAFDSLFVESEECAGPNMKALEKFYELCCDNPKIRNKSNVDSLKNSFWAYTSGSDLCEKIEDYSKYEKVMFEIGLLGFSVQGNAFDLLGRREKIDKLLATGVQNHESFVNGDSDVGMVIVAVKEFKERPQRNGQLMAFLKFQSVDGVEFESPAFSGMWKHVKPVVKQGSVYVATFNRKKEDPTSLVLGKPGFAHSAESAQTSMVDVDDLSM